VRWVEEAALVFGTGLRLGGYECCGGAARWERQRSSGGGSFRCAEIRWIDRRLATFGEARNCTQWRRQDQEREEMVETNGYAAFVVWKEREE